MLLEQLKVLQKNVAEQFAKYVLENKNDFPSDLFPLELEYFIDKKDYNALFQIRQIMLWYKEYLQSTDVERKMDLLVRVQNSAETLVFDYKKDNPVGE